MVENDPAGRLALGNCRGSYVWTDIVAGVFKRWILKLGGLKMTISPIERQGDLQALEK